MSKMFALIPDDRPLRISLKCDPALAEILRAQFDGVNPGYHLNKRHWNTVDAGGAIPDGLVRELIDHSYELVAGSLPRSAREPLGLPGNGGSSKRGARAGHRAPR